MKSVYFCASFSGLIRNILTKFILILVAINLSDCASNVGNVPSPQMIKSNGLQHSGSLVMPVSVHVKQSQKLRRALEVSPGPPVGDTNDECTTIPQGWECVIQNGKNTDGGFEFPGLPSGATVTYSAPPVTAGVTFTPATFSTTSPPYIYYYTETAASTAPVGNQYSATINATISGSSDFCKANYCGPAALTTYFQVSCSLSLHHCPAIDIKDKNLNKIVSASPPPQTNTVVGRQANLLVEQTANTGSGTYSLSNIQWNIPATTVASYDRSTGAAPVPVSASALTAADLVFYWTAGLDKNVIITGKLKRSDGAEVADVQTQARYDVITPVSTASAPVRGNARVGTRTDFSGLFLSDGDATVSTAGINFSFSVTNNFGYAGQISGTQLIDPTYTYDGATSSPTSGSMWLDNIVDYENPVNVGSAWTAIDAPAEGLTSQYKSAKITGSFAMYLMYKPKPQNSETSIWVTLQNVNWSWSAAAARTGNPNTWCLGGSAGCPERTVASTPAAIVQSSTSLPLWCATCIYKNGVGRTKSRLSFSNGERVFNTTPAYVP